ncbi:glutathione S-transferase family protein [Billgrantia kenyensis]|uniref:Glutathione S-transferase family protein n=1 Tax=Billgrantia kenyensis TaxID=321266 RepID=A0A7W0AF39_9GAMM|nr:glutathione S-transferase family protein [Halomonas kenyensis]MBA2780803.1 glutathione S-transferase family protein [Halomonas kenyensis]MCG6663628.1 glutathione S-transferase family protein [Halomonas kenyensis]
MEPVLFYGVPQGCSFGSIVALEWLGKPYRLCRIEMLEQPWDALYAKINPLFKTPALLLEDGEPLTESQAILQHLAARDPEARLGFAQGSREFDRLNQMLAYLNTDFFAAFGPLWTLYDTQGMSGVEQALLRRLGHESVAESCAYLNELLAEREWLLGDARSVADAYFVGIARWAEYHRLFDVKQEYPNLARLLAKLRDDPAVRFAEAIERGEQPAGLGHFKGHVSLRELESRLAA